jgi:molybdate transport system substrate-binding protein
VPRPGGALPRRGRRRWGALGVALALAAGACGSGASAGTTLTVFAAASLTDAFEAVATAFEDDHPGVSVRLSFAGSTSLREQLLAGAPADVFASASEATMVDVVEAGATEGEAVPFASNHLVLVTPAGNPAAVRSLADLARTDLLVGLCAPTVPCGELAGRLLGGAGVTAAPDTEEPDVRSLLTKVAAGDLDAALVYETDARAAGAKVSRVDVPGAERHTTDYLIAVLADRRASGTARAFVEHVRGPEGQEALAAEGFGAP